MERDVLKREVRDGVVWLTKDDPDTGNGMSLAMVDALEDALTSLGDARALVIDAAGNGFHSSAVLVGELSQTNADLGEADFARIVAIGRHLGDMLAALPIPVIGIARGGALGGGLELLMRSDFLFCTDDARFKLPEAAFGFVAAWGGTQYGARQMSFRRAQEFLLLGETFDGRAAEACGLVTRSFPTALALMAHVDRLIERLRAISPASFRETKRCLWAAWHASLTAGLDVEAEAQTTAMRSGDYEPGMAAAANRRAYDYVAREEIEKPRRSR